MQNVLIINGHQKYEGFAQGNLTRDYINRAKDFFSANGFNIKETVVEALAEVAHKQIRLDLGITAEDEGHSLRDVRMNRY